MFKVKKVKIYTIITFLKDMKLKGRQSRHRSDFVDLLEKSWDKFSKDEVKLVEEFGIFDGEGELIRNDDGTFPLTDVKAFRIEQDHLYNEDFVLEGSEYETMFEVLKEVLDNYDEELSGDEATIYNTLCKQLNI